MFVTGIEDVSEIYAAMSWAKGGEDLGISLYVFICPWLQTGQIVGSFPVSRIATSCQQRDGFSSRGNGSLPKAFKQDRKSVV
jgi:hypothetical protein